jgi:uncharacterized Zn finger protein
VKKPTYTEVFIRAMATTKSFERGEEYMEYRAVRRLEKRGDIVMARVEGSSYPPDRVRVKMEKGEVADARCNCPYDWGGWCKHIVAVLLVMLYEPDRVRERQSYEDLVGPLNEQELRTLLRFLTNTHPRLLTHIERWRDEEK